MMTLDEVKRMAALGEGLHLEFKRKVPRAERIAKEVVAFANTKGGKLLLGVDDDGTVAGLKDVDEELYVLSRALETHCTPSINTRIETIPVTRKREVVVVDVPESRHKPHFVKPPKAEGRGTAYTRYKDQSLEASKERVKLMRWERNPTDTHFEFGHNEQMLMRYLDQYERITVSQFARVANLPRKRASWILLLLARAGILRLQPHEKEDYFTLAYA